MQEWLTETIKQKQPTFFYTRLLYLQILPIRKTV